LIYSGRPDPEWRIGASQALELRRQWAKLPRRSAARAAPAALGYRGAAMRCANAEWVAYGAAVTRTSAGGRVEERGDPGRQFERALLATAPDGLLPAIEL
jgi:hypothetical protein